MGEPRVLLAGGYGVFGRHLARELLATTGARLVLAGRDGRRAEEARRGLGDQSRLEALALDLSDLGAVERAARGCVAVACTAGPFQELPGGLPAAAVRAGAHWLDVSDHPGWVLPILDDAGLHAAAEERGVAVMPGLSTVPAVSGVLARWCRTRVPAADRGRVTLFIGNRNAKGTGATASALMGGFEDPAWVELPFGRRRAHRFETPDRVLFERDLGVAAEFRVALEWACLGWLTATLGRAATRLGASGQTRLARRLSGLSKPFSFIGTELGCVQVDLWDANGDRVSAAAIAGQPVVILPCALALRAILDGSYAGRGVAHPAEWQPLDAYLSGLRSRGVRLVARTRGAVADRQP
jgi:hypothetical protein